MQWLSNHGGEVAKPKADTVARLSKVGASGRYPSNAERDTHRMLERLGETLDVNIVRKKVRMIDPSTLEEAEMYLPMVLPHDMCLALWQLGEEAFRSLLFGGLSEAETAEYWDHLDSCATWFQQHPARSWSHRGKLSGLATYGDGIQTYRNSECGSVTVLAFTPELSFMNDPMLRYFTIGLWSEHCESPNTFHDVIHYVVESFQKLLDPDEPWPWREHGYLLAFTACQGDMKFLYDTMGLNDYRANEFCSRCSCVKNADDLYRTLGNFSEDPQAFHEWDYSGIDMAWTYSALFSLPLTMERVQHDIAHGQMLGSGHFANGILFAVV